MEENSRQKNVALLTMAALSACALLCLRLQTSESDAVEEWLHTHKLEKLRDVVMQAGGY